MKKIAVITTIISLTLFCHPNAFSESMDEIEDQFSKEYEALKPPSESSSVRTDYKFDQTALATLYTTKMLRLMYNQNQQIISKYDDILQKYDKMIQQNEEVIKLLSDLAKQRKER